MSSTDAGADAPDWLSLAAGEEVVWIGHPTLARVAGRLVVGVVLFVGGMVLAATVPPEFGWVGGVVTLAGVGVGVAAYYLNRSTQYVVTTDGIYRKSGLLSREVTAVPLDRVQNTAYSQSPLQRLLSYGDVRVDTAGTAGTELVLEAVADPGEVTAVVSEQLAAPEVSRDRAADA